MCLSCLVGWVSGLTSKWDMQALTDDNKEKLITAVYIGSIFLLLAMVYFVNASKNLVGSIVSFFGTFTLAQVPGTSLSLPAPINPGAYISLYLVVFQFCLGLGILEMIVLALRIILHSPLARKAETVENIVFWLAASYLLITYLVNASLISEWFVFWSGIILIGGISLLARAFILVFHR
jgi:hypothetical protein